jgi:hypothetical protein
MSLHRVVLAGLAAVFTVSMTSLASAGGWGWGAGWGSGWGGWGGGCGICGAPSAAVVYAQPVAPLPPPPPLPPPAPIVGPGCGCHSVLFAPPPAPPIEPTPVAPAPIYVVNQGPEYSGPGIMVPYHTWRPTPGYGPPGYHYAHYGYGYRFHYGPRWGFRYGYRYGARPWGYGARFAYHRPFVGHPYHRWPTYPWNK